jgi:hypothetical protein
MLRLQTMSRMLFIFATANFFFGCGMNAEKKDSDDAEDQVQADAIKPEIDSIDSTDKNTAAGENPKKDAAKEKENAGGDEVTNEEDTGEETDDSTESEDDEDTSEEESSDLISQILPLLSGKGGAGGLNAGMLTSILGGGGASGGLGLGQITALLGAGNGSAGAGSATGILSALSNNQLKTLLGQLKP